MRFVRPRPGLLAPGAGLALALLAGAGASAQCVPQWSGIKRGTNWDCRAVAAADDDGPGPSPARVYFGGGFSMVGGSPAMRVAGWDGYRVVSPPGLGPPVQSGAWASAARGVAHGGGAFPPPGLYVGGHFSLAGTTPVQNIARWADGAWSDVGGGVSAPVGIAPQVLAVHEFDPDGPGPAAGALFVGGQFKSAGGVPADGLARWDGTTWSAVGGGLTGSQGVNPKAYAMTIFDDDGAGPRRPGLYVAGSFLYAGGQLVRHIARWDGQAWEALGQGVAGTPVMALAVYDDDGPGPRAEALYVGGSFRITANPDIWYLARWDGVAWSAASPIPNGAVEALAVFDDDGAGPRRPSLFAAGYFTHFNTQPYARIARWDGSQWWPVGSGLSGFAVPEVKALTVFDEDGPGPNPGGLYVGGLFYYAGGVYTYHVARWGCPTPPPCDPDCNNDGALNLADFGCFLTNFALLTPYADCNTDAAWNIADFGCFQTRFALGCP